MSAHFDEAISGPFVLTDIRLLGASRTILISGRRGKDLTATMDQPPQEGSLVQLSLGQSRWADAIVTWCRGQTLGVRLTEEDQADALRPAEKS